jgi:flagellar P-ring protein precursor FlgI
MPRWWKFRFPSPWIVGLILAVLASTVYPAPIVRLKDIATFEGVRENQLLGIGLVSGLAGKGDSSGSELLRQSIANLASSFGLKIDPDDVKSKNSAVVMVAAEIPPFARSGERIDLNVSSIGDARSLEGGILLQTNLQAADGQVYAVGQGRIAVSSSSASVKTVGTIPGGAIVEREVLSTFVTDGTVSIVLRNPDFVTAASVATAVRQAFEDAEVTSRDASLIDVGVPEQMLPDIISFMAQLESLTLTPDVEGKVVIDSQSGVVIVGENVRIGKVAVSYKSVNLTVGASVWDEEKPSQFVIDETASVDDLVRTLQTVGLETDTVIGILQAIEKSGALFGRLIIL